MNADALIGAVLGTYTMQKMIGRGEIGTVFLAQQSHPERLVAVKVLLPMLSLSPDQSIVFLGHLQHEIDAVIPLKHPNILPVYEHGAFYGLAYLAMPYVSSNTLRDELAREGALPLEKAALYLEQIAAACAFAHERGVIHGNIKPANIFVQHDGHMVLTDFGVMKILYEGNDAGSRFIKSRMSVGTFDYMAPEQVFGSTRANEITDLYSLGVILYQMVTGALPFQGQATMHQQDTSLRAPHLLQPELPIAVEQVILRALATYPADRYTSVKDFAAAFRQALRMSDIAVTKFGSSYTIVDTADTSLLTPQSSFNVVTQTSLLAVNKPDQNKADSASSTVTPPLKSDSNLHRSGVVDRTRFTLPSMSGFLQPFASQPASVPDTSLITPPQQASIPESSLPPTSARGQKLELQLITEEPEISLSQLLVNTVMQLPSQLSPSLPTPSPMTATAQLTDPYQPVKAGKSRKNYLRLLLACILLFAILIFIIVIYTYNNNHTIVSRGSSAKSSVPTTLTTSNTPSGVQSTPNNNNTGDGSKNFQVGSDASVVIDGHHSNVNVHSGNAGAIVVITRQHGSSVEMNASDTRIQYKQVRDGQGQDQISIATDPGLDVDYTLTVPSSAQVQIQVDNGSASVDGVSAVTIDTGGGNLDVEDIHGPVNINAVNGDITARAITGSMIMKSVNGSIRANNINGALNAVTSNGDVVVRAASLSGTSVLATNNGSVHFEGVLDSHGTYKMKTNSGNIDLTLPNNTTFQLAASTHSGSVSNDFGSAIVGNAPRAQVTINVGSGSVVVNKEP